MSIPLKYLLPPRPCDLGSIFFVLAALLLFPIMHPVFPQLLLSWLLGVRPGAASACTRFDGFAISFRRLSVTSHKIYKVVPEMVSKS